MNYYQFNCYSRDKRADLVWQQGRFLAIRTEMGCSVVLYHLSGFFVEVWYSPEDNQIALVQGFERRELLEPYLELIDLEGLLE
ncbi:hypothetical protein [Pontibacter pamirensis]|uniref:hypothetical protein n=1 Tax=Pontibacter pamirensis TaxID=2562824 RepID=UPI00138A1BFB|nr:hypothetical protein [Pontibacter pamirensis]